MGARHVSYEADGWGVGELWLEGDRLLLPRAPARAGRPRGSRNDRSADRFARYFAGAPDDFLDVELELDGVTDFERALTRRCGAVPSGEVGHVRRARRACREAERAAGRGNVLRAEPVRAGRAVPSRRRGQRDRLVRVARGRVQAASAGARGCLSLRICERAGRDRARKRDCDRLAELSGLAHTAGSLHLRGRGLRRGVR